MPARLPQDMRNNIQSLLQRGLYFSKIRTMHPKVGNSTLTKLKKLYSRDSSKPIGGRPKKLSGKTISRVSRQLRSGALDSPRAVQEASRSIDEDMSLSGIF